MEQWHDFYIAEVGASAALAGLLFVGVSLNLARILSVPGLTNRAFHGLVLMLAVLVISSLVLVPQSSIALGLEVLVIGILIWATGLRLDLGALRRAEAPYRMLFLRNMALSQAAELPYVIGGALLLAVGGAAGLYAVVVAVLVSFLRAVTDAWVLLVEINR